MLGFSAVVGCSTILSRLKSRAERIVLVRGRAAHSKECVHSVVARAQMPSPLPVGLPEITGKLNESRWNIGPGAEQIGQAH